MTHARHNPFRTERVEQIRYRPIGWTWDTLLARLADLDYRAAIVGPQGSGKTTLLEDLTDHLHQLGYMPRFRRLDSESPELSKDTLRNLITNLTDRNIILLDGCEQLRPKAWRFFLNLTRPARGLIVTTHHPGRLPTLVECQTSPELLAQIVHSLAGEEYANALDPNLLQRHHGNIREALRELYDLHAAHPENDPRIPNK